MSLPHACPVLLAPHHGPQALLDVANAVQYLHSLQLVHGDIKVGVGLGRACTRHTYVPEPSEW